MPASAFSFLGSDHGSAVYTLTESVEEPKCALLS
jgi:hypothetical protein